MPNRVLVLWADPGSDNLGLRILAEGAKALAERAWTHVDITYHSHNTPRTPLCKNMILEDIGRPNGPIKDLFRSFDAILDTGGGDSFSDIYGLRRLMLQSYMYHAASYCHVPVVMTPQTVGPFDSILGRLLARYVLKRSRLVATRDAVSAQAVDGIRGYAAEAVSSDLIFMLAGVDNTWIPDSRDGRAHIIVNVSGLLWNPNSHVDNVIYQKQVRELLQRLLVGGYKVSVMAHVLDSPLADNDVPTVRLLGNEFPGVSVLVPDSLEMARAMLASGSFVIGSRMHACLNALSVGTPAIAWAYSRKFQPLLDALGWNLVFDLRRCPMIVDETINALASADLELKSLQADAAVGVARDLYDTLILKMRQIETGVA